MRQMNLTTWLEDRMQSRMYRKGQAMITSMIVSGLLLTVWTAHMVVMSERMWPPS